MKLNKSVKNFGLSGSLFNVGIVLINLALGHGFFAKHDNYISSWRLFCDFIKAKFGIKDLRDIKLEHFRAWIDENTRQVNEKPYLSEATVRNRISHMNQVLDIFFPGKGLRIEPNSIFPRPEPARRIAPGGIDKAVVVDCAQEIEVAGYLRESILVLVMREYGLRKREAMLLDWNKKCQEAIQDGEINIDRGTKGGRHKYVQRLVPLGSLAMTLLERAKELQGEGNNLIPAGITLKSFMRRFRKYIHPFLKKYGIDTSRDLRAAFACDAYFAETGYPAPVVAGTVVAPRELDRKARLKISKLLGHFREAIVSAYIGGKR